MIFRWIYSAAWYLATPFIRRYLKKRALQAPAYLEHWDERFGRALAPRAQGAIWVHAVSVGETRAALPLIVALRKEWPDAPLLITQMTPTGRACAIDLYGDQAEIRYLPYDYPGAVRRFVENYRPMFGVLMETEVWPNLIAAAHRAEIPLFLANARLSEKSFNGYRKVGSLIRASLSKLTAIAAQSPDDMQRLQRLGGQNLQICGNTKYDFSPPEAQLTLGEQFRARIGARKVLVCASTRQGEEALILRAWQGRNTDCLLVLVPRHPERFSEVAALVAHAGLSVQMRSDGLAVKRETQVWIGDSMGEMFAYYRAADLVFIGGSLLPLGGQNLIEPASVGVPVLMGPSTYNFAQASRLAFEAGAALQVDDAGQMVDCANHLLTDENQCTNMRKAALEFSSAHRGASQCIVGMIKQRLDKLTATAHAVASG